MEKSEHGLLGYDEDDDIEDEHYPSHHTKVSKVCSLFSPILWLPSVGVCLGI